MLHLTPTRTIATILLALVACSAGCYEKVVSSKPFPGMAYTGKDAPPVAADYSNAFESQLKNDNFFAPIGSFTRGVGNAFKGIGEAITGGGDKPKPAARSPEYNSTPATSASAPPRKPAEPENPPASNEGSLFDTAPR